MDDKERERIIDLLMGVDDETRHDADRFEALRGTMDILHELQEESECSCLTCTIYNMIREREIRKQAR